MDVRIITKPITRVELKKIAQERFGDLVKAVVDVENRIIALGEELHADEEAALLGQGSIQNNLWGINIYPDIQGNNWIEFDSMINVRPSQNNSSRSIEDETIRKKIVEIVNGLIK